MNLKKKLSRIFVPVLLAAALVAPANAQVGNQFDLGDIIGIGRNGGYNNGGGIDTGAILGVANILYQITQQGRNDSPYYPNGYPNTYPNGYPYPSQHPNTYPNGYPYPTQYPTQYPSQYPNSYPNGYPYPGQYPQGYPNGYPTYPYQY